MDFPCSYCGRMLRSAAGRGAHERFCVRVNGSGKSGAVSQAAGPSAIKFGSGVDVVEHADDEEFVAVDAQGAIQKKERKSKKKKKKKKKKDEKYKKKHRKKRMRRTRRKERDQEYDQDEDEETGSESESEGESDGGQQVSHFMIEPPPLMERV